MAPQVISWCTTDRVLVQVLAPEQEDGPQVVIVHDLALGDGGIRLDRRRSEEVQAS